MSSNSESRKRREASARSTQERVLSALQRVFPSAELIDADALKDALEDEGLIR